MATIMEKARATVVLDHPFFAAVLLRHPIIPSKTIKTCCINGITGAITYNPDFIENLPVKQAVRVLCHELLHYVGMDSLRVGNRDHKKWNGVADAWINDMLDKMKIGERVPGAVHQPGASDSSREDLYAMLPEDQDNGDGQGGGGSGGDAPGQGPGQGQGGDDGDDGDGGNPDPMANDMEATDHQLPDCEKTEAEGRIKREIAEAGQAAKMRGTMTAELQKFIAETINSKIPWYQVLERLCTEHVKSDTSWARPNRRYAPDFYLPVVDGVGAMGEMVVQVDISGSVSAKEIEYYNGHLKAIVELVQPSKVHLIYTDTEVQLHEEFEKPEEMEIKFHSGGGTRMEAGFDYLEEKGIEPAVVVTLTDGYDTYTNAHPPFPVVWCVSSHKVPPYGDVVHFKMED